MPGMEHEPSNNRVLVIDDHETLRKTLCDLIEHHGYECKATSSGAEGVALLDRWCPTLVIFEPALRDGSATGLSHRLREWARERKRSLSIVAFTSSLLPDHVAETHDVDECIEKPSISSVHAALRRYLRAPLN